MCWRVQTKILTVICQLREVVTLNMMQCICEGHFALLVMVAVGLTIGGDVNDLGPRARIRERGQKPSSEVFSFFEQVLEGDGLRNGAIIKKHRDALAGWQRHVIGHRWIDLSSARIPPGAASALPRTLRLKRR